MWHTLEVRTTISDTPAFFRRIHYMAASLAALGESLSGHQIVVSVGSDNPPANLYRAQPWSTRYPITWRWVDPEAYARLGYRATNRDRALHMTRTDYVMMTDADVVFVGQISDLLKALDRAPAICGVMAHDSPFLTAPRLTAEGVEAAARRGFSPLRERLHDRDYWQLLAGSFGIDPPALEQELSGWSAERHGPSFRYAPAAYFNGAMVLGPADLMDEMCRLFPAAEEAIGRVVEPRFFLPQAARTLAIYKARLPHRGLPVRYNFPNDPEFDARYPEELRSLRVLHYLRTSIVHRDRDFSTGEHLMRLLGRSDLTGSNRALQRCLADLQARVSAEERAA